MVDENQLKHLAFVQHSSAKALSQVEKLYNAIRAYTPASLTPALRLAEDSAVAIVAPLASKAQDLGDAMLQFADNKMDKTLGAVHEIHSSNMKTFNESTEAYFNYISKTADRIVEQLNVKAMHTATVKGVQAARDKLLATVQQAREATDPDVAFKMAWDAWTHFAAHPAVAKILSTTGPATKLGQQAFNKLHDTLVSTPVYKSVIDRTTDSISYVTTTTPYKLGAHYLYPMVQPVADPAITTVTHSKVINQVVDYWRPTVSTC